MKVSHSQYLEKARKEAVGAGYLTDQLADFYHALFSYQEEKTGAFNVEKGQVSFFRKESFPFIDNEKLVFPGEINKQLLDSLEDLLMLIKKAYAGVELGPLSQVFSDNSDLIAESISAVLQGNVEKLQAQANKAKIGLDEYLFVILNWLKPLFTHLRGKFFSDVDTSEWLKTRCPFCGFHPVMSKIVEGRDNVRMLYCGLCENEWVFRRLTCAICENNDKDTQGYYSKEDSIYRFDYCDSCHGYIKTIRVPQRYDESRYDMTVENVITSFLDASAMDMGYNRP